MTCDCLQRWISYTDEHPNIPAHYKCPVCDAEFRGRRDTYNVTLPDYMFPRTVNRKPAPEAPSDTYETCYWKFINADDYDNAKYWFNQMIAKVTLELQPRADGKSWVDEPCASKKNFPWFGFNVTVAILYVVAAIVLRLIGII